ncbi:MAG: MATE family efflux transporter, partial [Polyangiaceae bacterium]
MRRLAVPAILHSLLQTLVFVVDRAMLGHHGESSLAAMQVAGPLEWSLWSIFAAFEVGTIARVGRHVGGARLDDARRAAWVSLLLSLTMGVLIAALSPLLVSALPIFFPTASTAAMSAAKDYLGITLGASPVVFIAATGIAILQAGGDTRTPLAIGLLANAIHIPLNRLLILGGFGVPAMGARGCAISTSFTFFLVAALTLLVLSRRKAKVSLRRTELVPDERSLLDAEARAVGKIALPALLERILYHAGYLGFVAIIGRLGDHAMAANQALISVEAICFLSADGFGIAAAALVAQKLGADRPEEGERAARISAGYAVMLLTSLGAIFFLARSRILPIFSANPEVIAIGVSAVPVLFCAQPFMAVATVTAQSLRGAGHTREVLAVSAACALGIRISCTWFFALTLGMGLPGVWIGSTCDWVARTALLLLIA